MRRIALASHVTTIDGKRYDGIGDAMKEALDSITSEYIFVRHSMDGLLSSEVQRYQAGSMKSSSKMGVIRKPSVVRYVSELIATVWHFTFNEKVDVYVGIDPLNAAAGVILKSLKRVDYAVFYTADYSPSRFNNKLLDAMYHGIDKFCVRKADEVWSVSSRIVSIREKMGLKKEKNILVPNVPPLKYAHKAKVKRNAHELITLGIIDKQLDFEGVFRAVKSLQDTYLDISLTIVGNGPEEKKLQKVSKDLGVEDRVHFTGRLPFNEAQERIAEAGVGLALYTGVWGFNEYGDSTKCREYFTYGVPVLSTNTHSTVEDIKQFNAGVITEKSPAAYVANITKLFEDYDTYSSNASELGRQYEGVREKELGRILSA